jgi:hypothetical protein
LIAAAVLMVFITFLLLVAGFVIVVGLAGLIKD